MLLHTTFRLAGKNFLLVSLCLVALVPIAPAQTTFNYSHSQNGGQLWNNTANWIEQAVPTATAYAYLPGSQPNGFANGDLFITNSSTLTSATAAVGTLIVTAPYPDITKIRATNQMGRNATMTFGSTSVGGALHVTPNMSEQAFYLAPDDSRDGAITVVVPRSLEIALNGDGVLGSQLYVERASMVGAGSLTVSRLNGTNAIGVHLRQYGTEGTHLSTFSGGLTQNAHTNLWIYGSSSLNGGGSIVHGPLGTATFTANGGTLLFASVGGGLALHNDVKVTDHSTIDVREHDGAFLFGDFRTGDNGAKRLTVMTKDAFLQFDNAGFSSSDTGTIAFAENFQQEARAKFNVTSGTSIYGGYVGEYAGMGTTTIEQMDGTVTKLGAGTFEARAYRVNALNIDAGTLRVMQEGTSIYGGSADAHTSRVHSLSIAVVNVINPAATLDLSNNEMIIEYAGTSPLAGTLSTGLGRWIAYAHAGGAWNQPGVKSSFCNEGTFAIGYGEATEVLGIDATGTGTFESQTVDGTSVLLKSTRYGDADLNGFVNTADLGRLSATWKEAGLWPQGDFDYSGDVNEGDYELLQNNYGGDPVQRPGALPPMAELYLATLEYPDVYWDIRFVPAIWDRFAEFEAMNLGVVPPPPPDVLARGIPEPAGAIGVVAMALVPRRRRSVA